MPAQHARGEWLLFLPADTALEPGWAEEAQAFMERVESGRRGQAAASFRFALDDDGLMPRLIERLVDFAATCCDALRRSGPAHLAQAYYVCGFPSLDFDRRPRRRELVMLKSRGVTSGERYRREGYFARSLRNAGLALLNFLRAPARALSRRYG